MKKAAKLAILCPTIFFSQMANASLPDGTLNGAASINMLFGHSTCAMEVYIYSNSVSASFAPNPSPMCTSMFLALGTATISGTNVTFSNALLITSYGNCIGTLQGSWNGTTLYIYGNLYGTAGSCNFAGAAS